jgi:endonuclease YncB( thermonuclease family)
MGRGRGAFPVFKIVGLLLALAGVIWFMVDLQRRIESPVQLFSVEEEISPLPVAMMPGNVAADLAAEDSPPPAFPEPTNQPPSFQDRLQNTVTMVYDGDTVQTADGQRVRYLGVDTPERGQPLAEEATALNKELVLMRQVRIAPCAAKPKDKYGRTLAELYVGEGRVGDVLLAAGMAEVFHDPVCIEDCRPRWKLLLGAFQKKLGIFAGAPNQPVPAVVADRLTGSYGLVVGVVDNVHESTKAYHVNFGSDWTTDFSVTIRKSDIEPFLRDKLRPHDLIGMEVTVFGKVISSNGPRIFVVCPAQIVTINGP